LKGKKQSEKSGSEKFLVNAIVYLTGAGNGKNLDETLALFMPVVKKVLAKTADSWNRRFYEYCVEFREALPTLATDKLLRRKLKEEGND